MKTGLAMLLAGFVLAGCAEAPKGFDYFLNGTPPCPFSGGTWIWDHLAEVEVGRAQGALSAKGYTNITTYGEANPLDPPGGPYHSWTVIGQCQSGAES